MSQEYPPLALDDLVHIMSPSPAPQAFIDDSEMPLRTKSSSPEPVQEADVLQMRKMVAEMHNTDNADPQSSPREKELAEMVRIARVISLICVYEPYGPCTGPPINECYSTGLRSAF